MLPRNCDDADLRRVRRQAHYSNKTICKAFDIASYIVFIWYRIFASTGKPFSVSFRDREKRNNLNYRPFTRSVIESRREGRLRLSLQSSDGDCERIDDHQTLRREHSFCTMATLIPSDALAVGIGAVCGALTRHQCGIWSSQWIAKNEARRQYQGWHTAAINIGGSFLLGCVTGAPIHKDSQVALYGLTPRTKLMLGTGFCGSFTTYSTYAVDIVSWLTKGHTTKAVSYIMANNVGGIFAATCGMVLVKRIFG